MSISKRVTVAILTTIGMINLCIRYPNINGEQGADGMGVHWMINVFNQKGNNPWILDFLSYFGMYPFSSPFGTQTVVSALQQTTGFYSDEIILIFGQILSILGMMLVFIMMKEFNNNYLFAIGGVLVFSNSFYFIDYTFWQISTRGPFIAIMPCLFFLVFKYENSKDYRFLPLLVIVYFLLLSTHRMVAFIVPTIFLPYFVIKIWGKLSVAYNRKIQIPVKQKHFYQLICIVSTFLSGVYATETYNNLGIPIEKLWIKERFHIIVFGELLNIASTYIGLNILLILSLIGFIYVILKQTNRIMHQYLIVMMVFQGPFIVNYEYFYPIFLSILSILGGYGIIHLSSRIKKYSINSVIATIVIIILIGFSYTIYIKELNTNISAEKGNHPEVNGFGISMESENTAMWIDGYITKMDRTIDNNPKSYQLLTFVDMRIMEDIDIIITQHDGELMDYIVVKRYSITKLLFNQREYMYGGEVEDWYSADETTSSSSHMYQIHRNGKVEDRLINVYKIKYLIEYLPSKGNFREHNSTLLQEANNSNYIVYQNELWNAYFYQDYSK